MDLANLYPTDLPLRDSRRSRGPPSQTGSLEISESLTKINFSEMRDQDSPAMGTENLYGRPINLAKRLSFR